MSINKKEETSKFPSIEREDWRAEDISNESSNQMSDEIVRQVLRGDESKGSADNRDVVGGSKSIDTPQGREEAKKSS
jgi:hypothetical protein